MCMTERFLPGITEENLLVRVLNVFDTFVSLFGENRFWYDVLYLFGVHQVHISSIGAFFILR